MVVGTRKPKGYWNKEILQEIALKYQSREEFKKKDPAAYSQAYKRKIMKSICTHMPLKGNLKLRGIYVICNEDTRQAYVGLTMDFAKREKEHFSPSNSCNSRFITGLNNTVFEKLTNYLDVDLAAELEEDYIKAFEFLGYEVLNNKSQVGAIGSKESSWNYVMCLEEAEKYKTRTCFRKESNTAYNHARKEGFLDAICLHMEERIKPAGYWTYERCKTEALKYGNKVDFFWNSGGANHACRVNGWIEDVCAHMNNPHVVSGYWTYDNVKDSIKGCKTVLEFVTYYKREYTAAQKAGFLEKLYDDLGLERAPRGKTRKWTLETVREEAMKYSTRNDFNKGNPSAYVTAGVNGWTDEVCKHMNTKKSKPNGYWKDYHNCKKEAEKYETRSEFCKGCGAAYRHSSKSGWLDEFFPL